MAHTLSSRTSGYASLVTSKSLETHNEFIAHSVIINRPRDELFRAWRHLPNLALFLENVERIDTIDDFRSRWVVKGSGGTTVEWISHIVIDLEGDKLSWRAGEDADAPNSGTVTFRDAGARGTVVTATICYDPPAGAIGKTITKMFQREPAIQARRDLRRFKQLMETGEITAGARTPSSHQEGGMHGIQSNRAAAPQGHQFVQPDMSRTR